MIASGFIIFFSREIEANSDVATYISNELYNNFITSYYTEFHIISSSINKTSSKEVNYIKFDKWQGTKEGCGKIKNKEVRVLEKKECEDDEDYLESINAMDIFSYKGFVLGSTTPPKSYYELLFDGSIIKEKEKCPEGKKNCGYIDTKYNQLCLDENVECPINYIKISKEPPKENITNIKTLKGEQVNIYYSNNPYDENSQKIPFVQASFKIGEDVLCSTPSLYYTNLNLFKLDKFNKDYANKCTLKDYNQKIVQYMEEDIYHSLDRVDNYKLYKENNIIDKINNSKLINYGYDINMYKDNILHLYVRTHFGFDKDCLREREKEKNIKEQLLELNGASQKMSTWSFTMLFQGIDILLSICDFVSITEIFTGDFSFLEAIIKNTMKSSLSTIFGVITWKASYLDDYSRQDMACSDPYTNDKYNVMIIKIRNNGNYISFCSWIFIGVVITELLILAIRIIWWCANKKESNKIKKYQYKIEELNKIIELQNKLIPEDTNTDF